MLVKMYSTAVIDNEVTHSNIVGDHCSTDEDTNILTEQRNCEILRLLQIYKNLQKSKLMLTCMSFNTFLRQLHKMVRTKQNRESTEGYSKSIVR